MGGINFYQIRLFYLYLIKNRVFYIAHIGLVFCSYLFPRGFTLGYNINALSVIGLTYLIQYNF